MANLVDEQLCATHRSSSFSLWDGLQINIIQAILLTIFVTAISYWLIEKNKAVLKSGLIALLGFAVLRSLSFIHVASQHSIIVYNIPQKQGIDFLQGRKYYFLGDTSLLKDDFARNFHLKPSRILHRVAPATSLDNFFLSNNYITYNSKHILLLNKSIRFNQPIEKEKLTFSFFLIIQRFTSVSFYPPWILSKLLLTDLCLPGKPVTGKKIAIRCIFPVIM
ncbi:MAG: hypothetical protein WDN26_07705 [Chitinophagaceae bacterium]